MSRIPLALSKKILVESTIVQSGTEKRELVDNGSKDTSFYYSIININFCGEDCFVAYHTKVCYW